MTKIVLKTLDIIEIILKPIEFVGELLITFAGIPNKIRFKYAIKKLGRMQHRNSDNDE